MNNSFQLLVGADAFIDGFAEALRDCHESLYVQFSTFEGDESGKRVADLMLNAAGTGVDVRLIVDCCTDFEINNTYPISLPLIKAMQAERMATYDLYDHMRDQGIAVQRTAPTGFMGMYMFYRNHKKMVVIDETTAFIGGLCVSDHNFGWHDFVVKIQGDLVKDIACDFTSTWRGKTQPFALPAPKGDFILNQCAGRASILQQIVHLVETAQASIVIESPYLMGEMLESKLLQAADRGIQVTIIMPFQRNKFIYGVWSQDLLKDLKHPNIHFFGIQGASNMTHAKLIVVDGKWAGFGSYNMFELESIGQKDVYVFSDNPDLLRQFDQLIENDVQNSVLLDAPRWTLGRGSYRMVRNFLKWWTARLVKSKKWVAVYG